MSHRLKCDVHATIRARIEARWFETEAVESTSMWLWRSLQLTAAHERMIFARLKGGRAREDAAASALGMLFGTCRALPCVRSTLAGDATVLLRSACGGCDVGDCARTDGAPLGADHVAVARPPAGRGQGL